MKKGLILLVLLSQAIISFGATGNLRGKVTDAKDGLPMPSAYVKIVELNRGIPTDVDGDYSISLEEGTYTIQVHYMGYDVFEKASVVISAGQTTILNAAIVKTGLEIKEVTKTVNRSRVTEHAIIIEKKRGAQIFDGIQNDLIQNQGASTAADGLKSVTGLSVEGGKYVYVRGLGDRYSKTTLNGSEIPSLDPDRNTVQMDLFPSNIISNMKVYKTFSPELPGDFTGGLVDIETKDFPDSFSISTSIKYGVNTQVVGNRNFLTYQGSNTDWLGYDNGFRDIPDAVKGNEIPTLIPSPSYDNSELEGMTKSFNNVMYSERKVGGINQSYSFSVGNQVKLRNRDLGYFLGMSYKRNLSHYGAENDGFIGRYSAPGGDMLSPGYLLASEKSSEDVINAIFLNFNLRINSRNKIGLNIIQNMSGTKSTTNLFGQWAEDGSVNPDMIFFSQNLQFLERRMNTFQMKGMHSPEFFKGEIDWLSSFTLSSQNEPDLRYLAYDIAINENGDTSYRISKNAYDLPSRYYRRMNETNLDNKLNIHIPMDSIFGEKSVLSLGVSYLVKSRKFRENRYDYFNTDDFDGDLQAFFTPENMTLTPYNPANVSTYILSSGVDDKNSYNGYQAILGTYAKLGFSIVPDRLKFSGGVRFEQTNINVASLKEGIDTGRLHNNDFLPAANLTWVLKEKMVERHDGKYLKLTNLRGAYSKTIARPTFRELAKFESFFFTGDFVLLGNPELERTVIHNFDLRYEIYPNRGEYISFSAFYKKFQDPIEKTQNPIAPNLEITFKNVGDAELYGVEFEAVKSMKYVWPKSRFLSNMRVGLNGSLIRSVVSIDTQEYKVRAEIDPGVSKTRPMYSQSPYLLNGYATYKNDSNDLTITLNYSVFGKRLALVSQGRLPDVYELPRPSLGLTAFKGVGEKFQLSFSAQNLLNPTTKFVHQYEGQEYIYSSFKKGMTFSLGVRYKI